MLHGRAWPVPMLATLTVIALLATPVRDAHAALRSPQVPVSGTALQSFFNAQGQTIDVGSAQLDAQRFSVAAGVAMPVRVGLALARTGSLGMYNAKLEVPPLYQFLPGAGADGWFVVLSFRDSPVRLIVNLFDANSASQGSNTYLGADRTDFGFYVQDAAGLFYSQDERNPGSAPHILAFSGTGAYAGATWFACETSAASGGDFADLVVRVDFALAAVPARSTTWGRVKSLYR